MEANSLSEARKIGQAGGRQTSDESRSANRLDRTGFDKVGVDSTRFGKESIVACLILLIVTVFALFARLYGIHQSLWLDELHTSWSVIDGPTEITPRAYLGNNNPVYFYAVWAITRIVGHAEWSLRLLSVCAGTAIIPLVYCLVARGSGGPFAAILAAVLAAIDPNNLFFSTEARPYAVVQLLGLLHVAIYWKAVNQPRLQWRALLIACGVLLFFLHYTASLLFAAEILHYLTIAAIARQWPKYRWYLADLFFVGLFCIPAFAHLVDIASRRDHWALFVEKTSIDTVFTMFLAHIYVGIPLLLAAFFAIGGRLGRSEDGPRRIDVRFIGLVCLWLLVPPLMAWMLTESDIARVMFRRYVVVSGAAPFVLSGLIVGLLPTRKQQAGMALVTAMVAGWLVGPHWTWYRSGQIAPRATEDWRSATAAINDSRQASTLPIFVRPGLVEADDLRVSTSGDFPEYCLFPVSALYEIEERDGRVIKPLPTTRAGLLTRGQWAIIKDSNGAWFLFRQFRMTADEFKTQLKISADQNDVENMSIDTLAFGTLTLLRVKLDFE